MLRDESLADALRRLRKSAGFSQAALAERAGLALRTVQYLERAGVAPQQGTLQLLLDALDVPAGAREPFFAASDSARSGRATQRWAMLDRATVLFGRERELGDVVRLIATPGLVTLIGPAGVGKTAIARRTLAQQTAFAERRLFVPLEMVADARYVQNGFAAALGLRRNGKPLREAIVALLREGPYLAVFDAAEHLPGLGRVITDLLADAPDLRLIVTSRARLQTVVERVYRVEPLPERDGTLLFAAAAAAVVPGFTLDESNRTAIGEVCRKLEGLPLAIELAASLAGVLPPAELLHRLDSRLELLRSQSTDLPPRQRSIRAAFSSSYDLLGSGGRRVLRAFAVFVGGAQLGALERMLPDCAVVEALRENVEHNLVARRESPDGRVRFFTFDIVRALAAELAAGEGEIEMLQRRHGQATVEIIEALDERLAAADALALQDLDDEIGNARAALDWAIAASELTLAQRVERALRRYWQRRHLQSEARIWADRLSRLTTPGR
jgi:predicted ATPase/DNA-binding XRE family transcriptional regulator